MGLFDALEAIFSLAGTVKEAANSANIKKTEEFEAEMKELQKELENKSDYDLLVDFHYTYADGDYEKGLIPRHNYFGSDPEYQAYCNVFAQRHIGRHEICCPHCEKENRDITLGYRYFFRSPKNIKSEEEMWYKRNSDLTSGEYSCWKCGTRFDWKLESYGYDFDYHVESREWGY